MDLTLSQPLQGNAYGNAAFRVNSLALHALGERTSPLAMLDDFRVNGRPFPPHPHAGFSAVTYVFADSPGGLRSRDSLGHDIRVGPGSIVWTEAGRGMLHQEVPARPGLALHGAQFFVNLAAAHKLTTPRTLWLDSADIPQWRGDAGDVVRVVCGSYAGLSSRLDPVEPFTVLDMDLRAGLPVQMQAQDYGLVYVRSGHVEVQGGSWRVSAAAGQGVIARGAGQLRLTAAGSAHVLFLRGQRQDDPVAASGPFIMNTSAQLADAMRRYQSGQMGHLQPLP